MTSFHVPVHKKEMLKGFKFRFSLAICKWRYGSEGVNLTKLEYIMSSFSFLGYKLTLYNNGHAWCSVTDGLFLLLFLMSCGVFILCSVGWLMNDHSISVGHWILPFLCVFSSYLDLFFQLIFWKPFLVLVLLVCGIVFYWKLCTFLPFFFLLTFETKLYVEKRNNSLLN